jgi:outer membrane protein assembly factor BamE
MRFLLILILLSLSGCFLAPHKVDLQQGNYVDQEMVSNLKLNMTRDQVLFAMGTPLVIDPFHPDRWDYVYLTGRPGNVNRERGVTLEFEDNKLVRISGDVVVVGESVFLQTGAETQ